MSSSHASDPDTEPRGFPLPLGRPGAHAAPPDIGFIRSQLLSTAAVAGALIFLLAVAGTVTVAADWYPTAQTAVGVAIGTVLVGILASTRIFLLSRHLRMPVTYALPVAQQRDPAWQRPAPVTAVEPPAPKPEPAPAPKPAPVPATRSRDELVAPAFTEGFGQWGEVFGELSGRLQSLVHRLIKSIDAMEFEIEDPDLQAMLFEVDHYATLARRQVENIAVLGGDELQRRANIPVEVNAVLRASVAEIQRYRQVVWVAMNGAEIHGAAIAEIIHLLSELLDNATRFSSDDAPKVTLRAQYVTAGLEIQIQDRGIGMDPQELRRINRLMQDTSLVDMAELFKDGRIGLAVVKELARRHGIGILLEQNVFHGTDASVVIPHTLLSKRQEEPPARRPSPRPVTRTADARLEAVPAVAAIAATPSEPVQTAVYHRHEEPRESDGPLPVRRRGTALADLQRWPAEDDNPHQPDVPQGDVVTAEQHTRPPLPQRRDQATHLPPQLLQTPVMTRPIPGHDTGLLADLQAGRDEGLADTRGGTGRFRAISPDDRDAEQQHMPPN
jgi:anti-sigma regulatory factor (Ser/Thr protein kinase)